MEKARKAREAREAGEVGEVRADGKLDLLAAMHVDQLLYTTQTDDVPGPRLDPEEREWLLRTLELRMHESVLLYALLSEVSPRSTELRWYERAFWDAGMSITLDLILRAQGQKP